MNQEAVASSALLNNRLVRGARQPMEIQIGSQGQAIPMQGQPLPTFPDFPDFLPAGPMQVQKAMHYQQQQQLQAPIQQEFNFSQLPNQGNEQALQQTNHQQDQEG